MSTIMGMTTLHVRDRMVLQLAGRYYRHEGRRVSDARELVGYSETAFWARVRYLLEQPAAVAAEPQIVNRLRRLHEARARQRSARRMAN